MDYVVTGRVRLAFLQDKQQNAQEVLAYTLLEWEELPNKAASGQHDSSVEEISWTNLLRLYREEEPLRYCFPGSPEEVVQGLAESYVDMDPWQFESLIAMDPALPPFEFVAVQRSSNDSAGWGASEEIRIHHRMLQPTLVPAGQVPVPAEFWLWKLLCNLTQQTPFAERPDLYRSSLNPDGIDPGRWRVSEASYTTDVLWRNIGLLDFQVTGGARFIVVEDLTLSANQKGRFLLWRWIDVEETRKATTNATTAEETNWSRVKRLYF